MKKGTSEVDVVGTEILIDAEILSWPSWYLLLECTATFVGISKSDVKLL
jgi:hypothetical protein